MERRDFIQLGAGAALASLPAYAAEHSPTDIKIGDRFNPDPTEKDFAFFKQAGVEYATIWTTIDKVTLDYMMDMRRRLEANGTQLWNIGILDLHCDPAMVLGLPERDEKIEQYKTYLRNLGRAGIRYTTYAHMANIKMRPYYATGVGETRGAKTRLFDWEQAKSLPLSHGRVYNDDEIWQTFTTFMRAVMPVAEKAGVRIGLHPDDPPVPTLGGVARVFRDAESYERAIQIADSDNFGLCFCIGTWAEGGKMMGKDVYEMIRHFGPRKKIFKVHFRNVDQPLPRFQETFIDNGYIDMYRAMQLLHEVKFDGVMIPDHVPESGPANNGWAIGHMRALRKRANSESRRT
ncbi:MAG: mannonate dehydratase [Bryobacteraceae bacterium]